VNGRALLKITGSFEFWRIISNTDGVILSIVSSKSSSFQIPSSSKLSDKSSISNKLSSVVCVFFNCLLFRAAASWRLRHLGGILHTDYWIIGKKFFIFKYLISVTKNRGIYSFL